jgi:hypothetical protein
MPAMAFDPHSYGPVFAPLLETDRRRALDGGRADPSAAAALKKLSIDAAFAHVPAITDLDMAACCISGVWLLHDYLDESHKISQGIDTPSGSFWHAIMHRREGDYSNAKYWFRHVGHHPVYDALGQHVAASLGSTELAEVQDATASLGETRLREGGAWDPFAFVDFCQAAVGRQSDARDLCLDIQQAEWELLFHHCYRAAVESRV